MKHPKFRKVVLAIAAPAIALAVAMFVSALVLLGSGTNPIDAFADIGKTATKLETLVDVLNRGTPLYISGIAAAIGFRMNLFNIGVEGQYLLAAFFAAQAGQALDLPPIFHVIVILLVAMAVGSAWAGVAGALNVTRGVNVVISTIMLNFIAIGGIIAALIVIWQDDTGQENSGTTPIPDSGRLPDLNSWLEIFTREISGGRRLTSALLIAIIVGIVYHLVINRTRFGFDLRSSGLNPFAARAGGVPPKRMIMIAMLYSGAMAGLVGITELLGDDYNYGQSFTRGLGFAGIAVALLGRNRPLGMAVAAILFAFLDAAATNLSVGSDTPREILLIMQGVILLSAVIAYEVVNRIRARDEAQTAAAEMAGSVS